METELVCKRCSVSFGNSKSEQNVFQYIRHLAYKELQCIHDIMADLNRFDLPPLGKAFASDVPDWEGRNIWLQ